MDNIVLENGNFDVTNKRYQMLFLFDSAYCVLRSIEHNKELDKELDSSIGYNIIYYKTHECFTPDDVLKDIILLIRAGNIDLVVNDVVAIKIDGALICYRFCGIRNRDPEMVCANFAEITDFFEKEKMKFTTNLHQQKKVLSVLDGRTYGLEEIYLRRQSVYCIEKEVYSNMDRIRSDYSLYTLEDMTIKEINPYTKPFVMLRNALYHFYKRRKANPAAMLLLDRYELEMVKDFCQLQQLVMQVAT